MNHVLRALAGFFFSLGGFGLLLLGVLDSSFLFMPLGNDLLVIALSAAHADRMLYYVLMATVGSVAGVDFTRWVSARGGRKGIEGDRKGKLTIPRAARPSPAASRACSSGKRLFASSERAVPI